jgi:hypothetical protein
MLPMSYDNIMTVPRRVFLATRTRASTSIVVVASTMAMTALPAGCGSPGPAASVPATTAAPTPPETPDGAATRAPVSQGTTTYMSDLRQVTSFNGNEFDHGVGRIGGRDLVRSLRTRFCKNQGQVAMYNLRQPYSNFVATVGLDDRSDPSASVRFTISVGDHVVFQEQARIGEPVVANVSVRDSNILTLSADLLSANSPCSAVAVWGEARVES